MIPLGIKSLKRLRVAFSFQNEQQNVENCRGGSTLRFAFPGFPSQEAQNRNVGTRSGMKRIFLDTSQRYNFVPLGRLHILG